MSRFKGKNSIGSPIKLFSERAKFFLEGYDDFDDSLHIRDLTFGEYQMYGRINHNMLPIIPQEEFMTFVNSPQEQQASVRVLDFVAEALINVQRAFSNACLLNAIPQDDQYLSVINPVKGYESPVQLYIRYMEDIMKTYHETYIIQQNRRTEILTIDHYMNHLVKYLKIISSTLPLTFSSWQKSKNSSIFTSGIAISIADIRIDDDEAKYNEFMSSQVFGYYLNVTKQHGFNVSKNSPWVLFADLDSDVMKTKHLKPRLINTAPSLFNSRFTRAYMSDLELLEEVIVRNYNRFVAIFPIEKEYYLCNNKYKFNILKRNRINSLDNIKKSTLIRLYTKMKNIEENEVFKGADLERIIKNGINFTNSFDKEKGIGYVNEKFRQTFKSKHGGINSIIKATQEYQDSLLEDE